MERLVALTIFFVWVYLLIVSAQYLLLKMETLKMMYNCAENYYNNMSAPELAVNKTD